MLPKSNRPYYLASPYSHRNRLIREQRFRDVHDYAGPLMASGHFVYCPIINTHKIAIDYALDYEFEWWEAFNRAFIETSAGIVVADMDGWKESRGVQYEIELAKSLGLPVWLMGLEGSVIAM